MKKSIVENIYSNPYIYNRIVSGQYKGGYQAYQREQEERERRIKNSYNSSNYSEQEPEEKYNGTKKNFTIDEINKELENINSAYRLNFDYLIRKRPFKDRKGIIRTDKKSYAYRSSSENYLVGASPENIKFVLSDNPMVKVSSEHNSEYITLNFLLGKIDSVKNNIRADIFSPRYKKMKQEPTPLEREQFEKEQAQKKISKPKKLNNLFKENGLNLEAIKTRTHALYTFKDIDFEDLNKYYTNPTLLIKDTSKPDTYYLGNLDQVYNAVKHGRVWELKSLLEKAYPVKYINKLLQDAGIKVVLDYDDNKILYYIHENSTTKPFATFIKLKCLNGHNIKGYKLEDLLNIIDKKEEILCPYCSENIRIGDKTLKPIKLINKSPQISNQEKWFREELISEINNSKYKNKVEISKLDDKEKLDTKYQGQENRNQDIDIFIKFPKALSYNGKEINGIGIACNGPLYHSYEANKGRQKSDSYNNVNINDTIRYNSLKYIILNWNEKGSSNEKNAKVNAKLFIKNRIFPILRSIFEGEHEIYDQKTYSRQMQDQRLGEISQALNDKCRVFEYGNIKIENLGKYFLLNKRRFAFTDGIFDKDKAKIWAAPLSDKFKLNDIWKKEIYEIILHNDDYLKANKISKGTVDYVNKNSRDTNLDLKQYDKVRANRQFARLFEEILKRQ